MFWSLKMFLDPIKKNICGPLKIVFDPTKLFWIPENCFRSQKIFGDPWKLFQIQQTSDLDPWKIFWIPENFGRITWNIVFDPLKTKIHTHLFHSPCTLTHTYTHTHTPTPPTHLNPHIHHTHTTHTHSHVHTLHTHTHTHHTPPTHTPHTHTHTLHTHTHTHTHVWCDCAYGHSGGRHFHWSRNHANMDLERFSGISTNIQGSKKLFCDPNKLSGI